MAGREHLFVSPCNTNLVSLRSESAEGMRRLRGVDGWQQHHGTLAPWRSEQLWPYHNLMSLDAWILHSGYAKSLHLVQHPRIELGSCPWLRHILPLEAGSGSDDFPAAMPAQRRRDGHSLGEAAAQMTYQIRVLGRGKSRNRCLEISVQICARNGEDSCSVLLRAKQNGAKRIKKDTLNPTYTTVSSPIAFKTTSSLRTIMSKRAGRPLVLYYTVIRVVQIRLSLSLCVSLGITS